MKHLMIVWAAIMIAAGAATAQNNRIYIEDFEIIPGTPSTVPLMLANESPTRGVQLNITLPNGLIITDVSLNQYAQSYTMNMFTNHINDSTWTVGMYPSQRVCFPPDTTAVMDIEFSAQDSFTGGEMRLWKCRGTTMDNVTIFIGDDTTRVSVPKSFLIGVPIDNRTKDQFFNLQGEPIESPTQAPLAIKVTTAANGRRTATKIARVQ